jgi:hypothetical protein
VPGDKRGVEAQPLVVPGVHLPDKTTHGVIYLASLASLANEVRAFDAADSSLLWARMLGTPVKGTKAIGAYLINDNWGILNTPVIDDATGIMYVVGWISPDGCFLPAELKRWTGRPLPGSHVAPSRLKSHLEKRFRCASFPPRLSQTGEWLRSKV